jgi:predicted NAD/FAD-binding protein
LKIAIIGSGVSGLSAAYALRTNHDVTVFEARDRAGGHAHSVEVTFDGDTQTIETGFIVFNENNYPLFTRLLRELGVPSQPSDMSFSVESERTGVAYRGSSLNTLFAQRVNVFRPAFLRMVRDIFRFFGDAPNLLTTTTGRELTLGDYLDGAGYSSSFVDEHILPLGAALWSTTPQGMRKFPARYFAQFLSNHSMLQVRNRPRWRTVAGGSSRYVRAITETLGERVRLGTPVTSIRREANAAWVTPRDGDAESFDHVVVATHTNQALEMLADADDLEHDTLRAIPYQANDLVLHTDTRLLPPKTRAWASWNYHVPREPEVAASVTYYMNELQNLRSPHHYCLTLNRTREIDADRVLLRYVYDHPVYTIDGIAAQNRRNELLNRRRTSFAGAYWGFGFHEDGVRSGVEVARSLGGEL